MPAPVLQRILDRCGLKPYTIAALALPLLVTGTIWSSYSSDPYSLLVSNGVMVGFGCCIQLTASWNGLYFMFTDNQIFLFNGFMLAGAGLGIVPVSLLFYFLEPTYGWRYTQKLTAVMYASLLAFAFVLCPPVRRCLGIRTREDKLRDFEALLNRSTSEHEHAILSAPILSGCETIPEVHEREDSNSDGQEHDDVLPVVVVTSARTVSQTTDPEHSSRPLKYACTNVGYMLAMVSFIFTAQAYDTIMVHQPVRMKSLGINASDGALALCINGAVQAVVRVSVGIIASRELLTPIRISQTGKVLFVITTAVSLFTDSAYYQTAYYFTLGFSGAILNTADFFLVKECLQKHRDFAVTLELSIAGMMTLMTMTLVGYLYQTLGSYDVPFCMLTGYFVLGLIPSILYEVHMKRKRRRYMEQYGYRTLS